MEEKSPEAKDEAVVCSQMLLAGYGCRGLWAVRSPVTLTKDKR